MISPSIPVAETGCDLTSGENPQWILPHASPLQLLHANSIKKEPTEFLSEASKGGKDNISEFRVNNLLALTVKRFVLSMASPYECLLCEESFLDSKKFKLHLWEHLRSHKPEEESLLSPKQETTSNNVASENNPVTTNSCNIEHQQRQDSFACSKVTLNTVGTEGTSKTSGNGVPGFASDSTSTLDYPNDLVAVTREEIPSQSCFNSNIQVSSKQDNTMKKEDPLDDEVSSEQEDCVQSTDSDFCDDGSYGDAVDSSQSIEETAGQSLPKVTNSVNGNTNVTKCKLEGQASLETECVFSCSSCKKTFTKKWQLTRHEKYHKPSSEFPCEICDIVCSKPSLLKQHMKFKHSEIEPAPAVCTQCNKTFPTQRQLRRHVLIHSDFRFRCLHCENVYKDNSGLLAHCRTAHGEGKAYQCEICFHKFATPSQLKRHCDVHNNQKFTCDVCNRCYNQRGNLTVHMRSHRGEEGLYKCDRCALMFRRTTSLKEHITVAHGPLLEHKCTKCDKTFNSKLSLYRHTKWHEGAYCKQCAICSKDFSSSWALKRHMKRNHEDKP